MTAESTPNFSSNPVQTPKPSTPTVNAERESIGKKLIIFAWAVEICAVIIGFAISIMQGITSFEELEANNNGILGFGDYTNIFIAMMPFLMVAIVEITKIPFVGATYKTSHKKWKFVFAVSLLFLAFITFESALNGFERNFHALIFSIDKHKKELVALEEEIIPLTEKRERLANLSAPQIESEYSQRHAIISEERSRQANIIQDRIQGLRAASQTEYIKGLNDQIDDRRDQVRALGADRQKEIDALINASTQLTENASSEISTQRRSLQQQLINEQDYLQNLREEREKKIEDAGFFSENKVREQENKRVNQQEQKVEGLRTQLNELSDSDRQKQLRERFNKDIEAVKDRYQSRGDKLNKEIQNVSMTLSKSLGSREKDIENVIKTHMKELTSIESKFQEQQKDNETFRENSFKTLSQNKTLVSDIEKTLFEKQNQRVELRNLVNIKVGDNQVYRMAQWWFNKESAADLDRKDVMSIAGLWFGSLAMLIAVTGILLAFASYVIRDPYIEDRSSPHDNLSSLSRKTFNSLRRLFIYWRRIQRSPVIKEVPKEVIKEVPVEKIIRVEVPVEIIKKEIVHVPLYTSDKSLLTLANNEKFDPKDIEPQPHSKKPKPQDIKPESKDKKLND
ncbi:MAG: hypothetical protein ACI8O8_000500 [Oleiphilaceae bacterium]|jgi:hypothetical protein